MRRIDNRAVFPVRAFNDARQMINNMNRVKTRFSGGGDNFAVIATLIYQWLPLFDEDYVFNGPSAPEFRWRLKRGILPRRTLDGRSLDILRTRSGYLRFLSRGGTPYRYWGNGYDGMSLNGLTEGDMTMLGTSLPISPYSHAGGPSPRDFPCYIDDALADYSAADPVLPPIPSNQIVGGMGAPAWENTFDFTVWANGPGDPVGVGWNAGWTEGEGIYQNFPASLAGALAEFNWVGTMVDYSSVMLDGRLPAPAQANVHVQGESIDFGQLLKSIPDGSIIISAKMEARFDGMEQSILQGTSEYDPGTDTFDTDFSVTTSNSDISLVLMERTTIGGRYVWEVRSAGTGNVVASGLYQIIDITALCQTLIDTCRSSPGNAYTLFPSPYAGFSGSTDMRGFLASMRGEATWTHYAAPFYSRPPWSSVDLDGYAPDRTYVSSCYAKWLRWTDIQLEDIIIEFQYPDSTALGVVSYRNTVRCDSPTLA